MADTPDIRTNAPLIACDICRKELSPSAVFTPEGVEYVQHFCGIECYQQFLAETKQGEKAGGAAKP